MLESITNTLQSASMGPAAVPLAFLLGLVSAVASACCTCRRWGCWWPTRARVKT